jgi:uncharacterized membrane-anchored protein
MIKGRVKVDEKTKELVQRLRPNDIAVIKHRDLDEIAAIALIKTRPKLVINCEKSISGKYPNLGPLRLIETNVPLFELPDSSFFHFIDEGEEILLKDNKIICRNQIFEGTYLKKSKVLADIEAAERNYQHELTKFVRNTLHYATKEIDLITQSISIPKLKIRIKNRHLLIVVRGHNYEEDLCTLRSYITEIKPVIIGVDGGADALLDFGYKPHIILGDMDSVTDRALKCGAELIVHAYPDGRAPGQERLNALNLSGHVLPSPGTSEDVAMLLGYEQGADLIVAVGTHSNFIDFLNKGRKGMGSTFLVRLKIGAKLVDAKGVSKLYRHPIRLWEMAKIVFSALIPLVLIIMVSPKTYQFVRLLFIRIRLVFNI